MCDPSVRRQGARRDLRGMPAGWARLDGGGGEILQYVSVETGAGTVSAWTVLFVSGTLESPCEAPCFWNRISKRKFRAKNVITKPGYNLR